MTTKTGSLSKETEKSLYPFYFWLGLSLIIIFWYLNWALSGARTHWGFFPLWLGYCLVIDGIVFRRTGTSLLTRSWRKYIGLFLASAPVWWIFELLNLRTQNWTYLGAEIFSPLEFVFWTTLSFTTVIPAVFGSAELFASFDFIKRLKPGPKIATDKQTTATFFVIGLIMLALLLIWPKIFFLFIWLSLYFILEPINIWMGNPSLIEWTQKRDWRPVISLWLGVLLTAFFWELWNFYSFPKWIYHISWGDWLHVFEMPLLGYGGYLPFALELYAIYHLIGRLLGVKTDNYLRMTPK
ncbi:MAG: hypothetical protein QGD88_04475 [Anaerolineae bacterium]|nr:hypothetical protein [Anaerolineae bacterium]MDK1080714.1 hypothetical protein [Anaerolineae bacterium]